MEQEPTKLGIHNLVKATLHAALVIKPNLYDRIQQLDEVKDIKTAIDVLAMMDHYAADLTDLIWQQYTEGNLNSFISNYNNIVDDSQRAT